MQKILSYPSKNDKIVVNEPWRVWNRFFPRFIESRNRTLYNEAKISRRNYSMLNNSNQCRNTKGERILKKIHKVKRLDLTALSDFGLRELKDFQYLSIDEKLGLTVKRVEIKENSCNIEKKYESTHVPVKSLIKKPNGTCNEIKRKIRRLSL